MIQNLPRHHLPQDLLLEYAAGTTKATTSLLVACHLTLCPHCRREVSRLEEIGANLLEHQPDAEIADSVLARTLAALDTPASMAPVRASVANAHSSLMPLPLLDALAEKQAKLQRVLPGVRSAVLPLAKDLPPARLVLFQPGIRIPSHGHQSPEFVLVLDGLLEEEEQQFRRGDVAFSDTGKIHTQMIGAEGPCLALIVNEGPITPQTLWGKVLKRLVGL